MVVLAQSNTVSNDPRLTETEEGTLAKGEGQGQANQSTRAVPSKHEVESSMAAANSLTLR